MAELLGRDQERTTIQAFLDRSPAGREALLVEGEPVIGTSLWRDAIRLAEAQSGRVLACRAAETETKLSFSAPFNVWHPPRADWCPPRKS